jgi:hypothetical protein
VLGDTDAVHVGNGRVTVGVRDAGRRLLPEAGGAPRR